MIGNVVVWLDTNRIEAGLFMLTAGLFFLGAMIIIGCANIASAIRESGRTDAD